MIRTRGFFVWEVMAALVLLAAVMLLLATSLHARQRVDQRMAARLAATEAARTALLYRQNGMPLPPSVQTRILDTPTAAGKQWIAVRATTEGEQVELIGLAPATPKAGAP